MNLNPPSKLLIVAAYVAAMALACMPSSRPAAAQERAGDPEESAERVVSTADGSSYRGELLEYVPRDHITLRLATGQIKRFEWSQVRRVAVIGSARPSSGGVSPQPVPAPAPPPRPAPRASSDSEADSDSDQESPSRQSELTPKPDIELPPDLAIYKDKIARVALRSGERRVRLEYLADSIRYEGWSWGIMGWGMGLVDLTAEKWSVACKTPCGVPLARKATYRITGRDIMTSEAFTLPSHGSNLTLHVKPGSRSLRVGAWVSLTAGGVLAAVGGAMLLSRGLADHQTPTDLLVRDAGIGLVVPGLALVVASIPMFVVSKTSVTISGRGVRDEEEAD